MAVKIKISYNTEAELAEVIRQLAPLIDTYKVSKNKEGQFKKAYATLKNDGIFEK